MTLKDRFDRVNTTHMLSTSSQVALHFTFESLIGQAAVQYVQLIVKILHCLLVFGPIFLSLLKHKSYVQIIDLVRFLAIPCGAWITMSEIIGCVECEIETTNVQGMILLFLRCCPAPWTVIAPDSPCPRAF